jgi:POT family proton-dependent oligopeptide transporter
VATIWIVAALLCAIAGIPVAHQLRHHPRGLWLLFFTEMWERFSYYGMRSLLIFYLTEHFLMDDRAAQGRYTAYVTLNYLLPLAGGLLGDRILGARRAVAFGALLLVAGHSAMAIENSPARATIVYAGQNYPVEAHGRGEERLRVLVTPRGTVPFTHARDGALLLDANAAGLPRRVPAGQFAMKITPVSPWSQALFNLALALIIVGVGYQKSNMTALVGALYTGRPDRDQGFTLYMFGINIGAFWSSVLCGWLGMEVGWWAGFGAAGLGMAAGYIAFIRYAPVLEGAGTPPPSTRPSRTALAYAAAIPAVGLVWWLEQDFALTGTLLTGATVAVAGYLLWLARRSDGGERRGLMIAMLLVLLGMLWTALAEQDAGPLSLFSDRNTNLRVFGSRIDAAQVQAFYMGFLLVLVPALAWLWDRLARRGRDPAPVTKFALAFALQSAAFLTLGLSGGLADAGGRIPLIVVVVSLLLHAASEMTIGPIALAEITRLAPRGMAAMLAAVWYLSVSWGQWLGGMFAQTANADGMASRESLPIYLHLFATTGLGAILGTVVALAVGVWLRQRGRRITSFALDSR